MNISEHSLIFDIFGVVDANEHVVIVCNLNMLKLLGYLFIPDQSTCHEAKLEMLQS